LISHHINAMTEMLGEHGMQNACVRRHKLFRAKANIMVALKYLFGSITAQH
jgi:hypothetical protein